MQVNKYKHPCICFPEFMKPYEVLDSLDITQQVEHQHSITLGHFTTFDNLLVKFICGAPDAETDKSTRITRFNNEYLSKDKTLSEELPSDQVEALAKKMFFDDLKSLKVILARGMQDVLIKEQKTSDEYAKERAYFMECIHKDRERERKLEDRIAKLERDIEKERELNKDIFVEEYVSSLT